MSERYLISTHRITPACRTSRGDEGAFEEAVRRLREQYEHQLREWSDDPLAPTFSISLMLLVPEKP